MKYWMVKYWIALCLLPLLFIACAEPAGLADSPAAEAQVQALGLDLPAVAPSSPTMSMP